MDTIMEDMEESVPAVVPDFETGGGTNLQMVRKNLGGPSGRRLNSTGTYTVGDTLSSPNNELMIMAVAESLYGYIFEATFGAAVNDVNRSPTREVTKKLRSTKISPSPPKSENLPPVIDPSKVPGGEEFPSLERIAKYLREIFRTAQCSVDCTIVSLIYIERLMQTSGLQLTTRNWRSLVAIAMLLASKVNDDLSMINADFACFLPFTVEQINGWERQFLAGIKYDVRVSTGHYTKYYFDLRDKGLKHFVGELDEKAIGGFDANKAQQLEIMYNQRQMSLNQGGIQSEKRSGSKLRRAVSDQYCPSHQEMLLEPGLPEAPAVANQSRAGSYFLA